MLQREQGQGALRRMMRPSPKSLVQDVRKGKQVPLHGVKTARLKVLLAVGKYAHLRTWLSLRLPCLKFH